MKASKFVPKRYQLKKGAVHIVHKGHPWIFRDQLSSAAEVFPAGQWLKLVDHENEILGYGMHEPQGLIGIRVLKRGKNPPDLAWVSRHIEKSLAGREQLRGYTDAFRAVHGENDGLPGIVVDVYGKTGVLQTYSPGVDSLGRYVAAVVTKRLGLENLVWKMPAKRKASGKEQPFRVLRGRAPELVKFREGKMHLSAQLAGAQKSGTFLDLRGLRKWISLQNWNGKKVLNLFAYTGTMGLAAEHAGAAEIWNVDIAQGALDFGKKHHAMNAAKHRWVKEDVFKWIPELAAKEKFDVIIVDPPMMVARTIQIPNALDAFRRLYHKLLGHLPKRGIVIACDCSSRIARKRFRQEMEKTLGYEFRLLHEIAPEDDHPVGFPEGDYLKMFVFGYTGDQKGHPSKKSGRKKRGS